MTVTPIRIRVEETVHELTGLQPYYLWAGPEGLLVGTMRPAGIEPLGHLVHDISGWRLHTNGHRPAAGVLIDGRPLMDVVSSIPPGTHLTLGAPRARVAPARVEETRLAPAGQEWVIGRTGTKGANIQVDDPLVHAEHARVRHEGGYFHVMRGNGRVFVNGQRVIQAQLKEGEPFVVGQTTLVASTRLLEHRRAPDSRMTSVGASAGSGLAVALEGVSVYAGGNVLLNDLTVGIAPGEIVAIIGPSGAGKSTMIKVLLGELRPDRGQLLIGGSRVGPGLAGRGLRDQVRYVPQSDDVYSSLTVEETLTFAARLRTSPDYPDTSRRQTVQSVLDQLKLTERRRSAVAALSGGERKRLSIGVELVGRPQLLLLDEPTSGLDAGMDRELFEQLARVAKSYGCTVIVVTHSLANLHLANKLVILARGGRVAYQGPPRGVLTRVGQKSWAEWLLVLNRESQQKVATGMKPRTPAPRPVAGAPRLTGMRTTLARQLLLVMRRGPVSLLALVGMPLLGCLISVLASGDGLRGARSAQTLAILVTVAALTGASLTYQDLVHERPVLKRDWRVGVSSDVVVLTKSIVYGAICVLLSLLMTVVFGAFRSLPDPRFGMPPAVMLFLTLLGIMVASMGLGLTISAIADSLERAVTWNTMLAVLQVALNGALFKLPDALEWLALLLPARLGLAGAASYADLNESREAVGLYTDPLWNGSVWTFAGLVGASYVIYGIGGSLAIRLTERRWGGADDDRRVTAP